MKRMALLIALLSLPSALAGPSSQVAKNVAEGVMKRFGREAVKEGTGVLAKRLETAAAKHGPEVFAAVTKVGPKALPVVEQAGVHGAQAARVMAKHGEHGLAYVATRPKAMQLVATHGEAAASVLVKTHGVAEHAVETLGKPAVKAFESIGNPQNARRLAMMAAEGGELAQVGGKSAEVLGVIEKYGDPAMEFIWRHKGALTATAVMTAFLAQPKEFIGGAKDIAQVAAENGLKPLAEVPVTMAKEGTKEIAKQTNWTIVLCVVSAIVAAFVGWNRVGRKQERITVQVMAPAAASAAQNTEKPT